jgi:glycosyltransferase involved in cell wall biosynthesis
VNNATDTLKKYDFAVFPSYFEGFPIGLLEMQSAGLPCVGLEGCSGVNELIIDKYNGFLVPKSSREFARKIEKLIKDPDMRKRFSANAYKEARKYNFDVVSQKWLNVVQDIVYNKHNSTKYVKSVKRLFDIPEFMKMNPLKKRESGINIFLQ